MAINDEVRNDAVAKMDLTKKVELHFGRFPLQWDNPIRPFIDEKMRDAGILLFHALYFRNDLPAEVHNRTTDVLQARVERGELQKISAFLVDDRTGMATFGDSRIRDIGPDGSVHAAALRDTGLRYGGFTFSLREAKPVLDALQAMGYEIVKKYE
ncbi:hypothetical protein HY642_05430 [Candidatus Woesearchaeota archaeon]|nr:hypothetical protein [Candidatus Woesearchaeota archaeon]